MQALIDADIVAYRCSASAEGDLEEVALMRVQRLMEEILYTTKASSYRAFLSGDNNFRYQVFPNYKANRKDVVKPEHLKACQDYLITEWKAEIIDGCEADDALGMNQTGDTVICSIDKDLLQIPGNHYNFVKQEWRTISEEEGRHNFYMQLLTGDATDGISGIKGVGPKTAAKYLEGCETEEDYLETVCKLYNNDTQLDQFAKCLWVWRHEGDIWDKLSIGADNSAQGMEQLSGSTMQEPGEINQFTEHTSQEIIGFQQVGQAPEVIFQTERNAL